MAHRFSSLMIIVLPALLLGCQSAPQKQDEHSHHDHSQHMHHEHKSKRSKMGKAMKEKEKSSRMVAYLEGTSVRSQTKGTLHFTSTDKGIKIEGEIEGLKPNGTHAIHIHEFGDCSADDATSAGAHYNPSNNPHALPPSEKRHAGDLGNITANGKGVATVSIEAEHLSLGRGRFPIAGRAMLVHNDPDTGKGDAGEAGARIACGVIGFTKNN